MKKNIILQYLFFLFLLPADILFLFSGNREIIKEDIKRLLAETPYKKAGILALNYLLMIDRPFRNIFYFRAGHSLILKNVSRLFIRPLATVEIVGEIGAGFRISHNYGMIHPWRAGNNLTVNQGVTIGKGKASVQEPERVYPIIGDNVSIYSNAVVFGGITIGSNVEIGAGAVVNKDIPDNCTVVGNPFRIIPR